VLSVEGGVEGRVREVNWRSTLISTGNGDVAVVPNSVMANVRSVNHSLPAPVRRCAARPWMSGSTPGSCPSAARAALGAAVQACRLPLADPPPAVVQTALRGD
jgi:small-conductance mechanosensitive channel